MSDNGEVTNFHGAAYLAAHREVETEGERVVALRPAPELERLWLQVLETRAERNRARARLQRLREEVEALLAELRAGESALGEIEGRLAVLVERFQSEVRS